MAQRYVDFVVTGGANSSSRRVNNDAEEDFEWSLNSFKVLPVLNRIASWRQALTSVLAGPVHKPHQPTPISTSASL